MESPRTDLDPLRRMLELPAGTAGVTWVARPLGQVGLGPTDLEALIWIPGPSVTMQGTSRLDVPSDLLAKLRPGAESKDARTVLEGASVALAPKSGWAVVGAVGTAEGTYAYLMSQ